MLPSSPKITGSENSSQSEGNNRIQLMESAPLFEANAKE